MPSIQLLRSKYRNLADRYFKQPDKALGRSLDLAHEALRQKLRPPKPPANPKPVSPPPVPRVTQAALDLIRRRSEPVMTAYARSLTQSAGLPREASHGDIMAAHSALIGQRVAGLAESLSQ